MTGLFSRLSFPVWGYRLSIGYCEEGERRGRCPKVSFWVLILVSETRLPGFISSTTKFSRWPGQEQEAPSPVIFSEKATQTSEICFEVKFCFGLCTPKLKFRLHFVTISDACVAFASGGAGRAEMKRDGTRAETRFGFPAKRTSPFISAGMSVQSAAGSRGVRINGSNAG